MKAKRIPVSRPIFRQVWIFSFSGSAFFDRVTAKIAIILCGLRLCRHLKPPTRITNRLAMLTNLWNSSQLFSVSRFWRKSLATNHSLILRPQTEKASIQNHILPSPIRLRRKLQHTALPTNFRPLSNPLNRQRRRFHHLIFR